MTSPLKTRIVRYLNDAARAFERAPVEVAVAVVVAAGLSYAIETTEGVAMAAWAQVAIASTIVLAGAWTGTVLHALGAWSLTARWASTLGGAVVALLYAVLVPDLELTSEAWRAALIVFAAVFWIVAMPLLGGTLAGAIDRVRVVNGRLLLRTLGALLYTAALYAGLALALAAINNLFELDFDNTLYGHVAGWLFFVLAPWIIVGGLPDYARPIAARSEVAGVVHRMSGFLVPPLLAIYFLILYAYAIRIAVTGEIPKNLVSPLVLAAGLLGTLTLFLFEPREAGGPAARALRLTPPLFLPLAGIGLWTILVRVEQYGWTEFRIIRLLALALFAGLAIAATVQLVRRRRFALYAVPLTFALIAALAAIGPWSVLGFARRDQQARLAAALRAADIDPARAVRTTAPRMVSGDVYDPINNIARYLAQHFGREALPPALASLATERDAIYNLAERLGLRRSLELDRGEFFISGQLASGAGVDVGDYTVHRLFVGPTRDVGVQDINAVVDSITLRVHIGTEILHADLGAVVGSLDPGPGRAPRDLMPDQARSTLLDAAGRARGTVVVLSITGRVVDGVLTVPRMEALLLLARASETPR